MNMNPMNVFNGMFGKIEPGLCRLSATGGIAIKTTNGYKSYNLKTGRLTNCSNFVFPIGEDYFFVIPTNHVKPGDNIIVNGAPKCVVEIPNKNEIKVMNYETSTLENMVPERHVFMGNTYFYGKIVSMLGNINGGKAKGMKKIVKYMMMMEMFKGNNNGSITASGNNNNNPLMQMMGMSMMFGDGGFDDMFDGMFDMDDDHDEPSLPDIDLDDEED